MNGKHEWEIPAPSHHVVVTSKSCESEISLKEVLSILKRQRYTIFGVILAVVSLAVLLAFLLPKTYRAEAIILPPNDSEIELLNIPNPYSENEEDRFIYSISVDELYSYLIRNLKSNELRYAFFQKNGLYEKLKKADEENDAYKVFDRKFNEALAVKESNNKKQENEEVAITLEGPKRNLVMQWLNEYLSFVDKQTIDSIKKTIGTRIDVQVKSIQEHISSLREVARKQRNDELERLGEALAVAEKLKIENPISTSLHRSEGSSYTYTNNSEPANEGAVTVSGVEEYYRGTKALLQEIEVLKKRKNDDPFIPDLRRLQEEMALLQKMKELPADIHAARIDQPAVSDSKPVKPRKSVIVVLAFVLGVFMAVGVAFFKEFLGHSQVMTK